MCILQPSNWFTNYILVAPLHLRIRALIWGNKTFLTLINVTVRLKMCIGSSVACKEPVRHKLPQTISFIDIDGMGIWWEFDISLYFKWCRKICCKRHSFHLIYAHYEKWKVHSDTVLPVLIVHWQDLQTNTWMCSSTLLLMPWKRSQ